jgi:hypothetical protein
MKLLVSSFYELSMNDKARDLLLKEEKKETIHYYKLDLQLTNTSK